MARVLILFCCRLGGVSRDWKCPWHLPALSLSWTFSSFCRHRHSRSHGKTSLHGIFRRTTRIHGNTFKGQLLFGYYFTESDQYDITWTTPQCILTLRLIGLTWDVYDGHRKDVLLSLQISCILDGIVDFRKN